MDSLSPERRSWNMSQIRGRDTKPEVAVRSVLHRLGIRFRLHSKGLPGKPDIVLPGRKTVVFVHGCFWHRHVGCNQCYFPKSNIEFWQNKFAGNQERDQRNIVKLKEAGWRVVVVWECELSNIAKLRSRLRRLFPKAIS